MQKKSIRWKNHRVKKRRFRKFIIKKWKIKIINQKNFKNKNWKLKIGLRNWNHIVKTQKLTQKSRKRFRDTNERTCSWWNFWVKTSLRKGFGEVLIRKIVNGRKTFKCYLGNPINGKLLSINDLRSLE